VRFPGSERTEHGMHQQLDNAHRGRLRRSTLQRSPEEGGLLAHSVTVRGLLVTPKTTPKHHGASRELLHLLPRVHSALQEEGHPIDIEPPARTSPSKESTGA